MDSNLRNNIIDRKASMYIPNNILAGYSMQWALNQPLVILNTQQIIYVNAYKLATRSKQFKELLRFNKDRQIIQTRNDNIQYSMGSWKIKKIEWELNKFKQSHEDVMSQNPLFIYCENLDCIKELAFTIHYCHIGNCNITSIQCFNETYRQISDYITRINHFNSITVNEMSMKQVNNLNEIIYYEENLMIKLCSIDCTLLLGLHIANKYGLYELTEICYNYIKKVCNPYTCWQLWKSTLRPFSSKNIQSLPLNNGKIVIKTIDINASKLVEDYILINFNKLLSFRNNNELYNHIYEQQLTKYEELTVDELEYLLTSDYLNISREGDVINAIQRWLETTPERTKNINLCFNAAPRLLSHCVRIHFLELNDLETIYEFPYLKYKPYQENIEIIHHTTTTNSNSHTVMVKRLPRYNSKINSSARQLTATRIACVTAFRQARRKLLRIYRNLRPLDGLGESQSDSVITISQKEQLQHDMNTSGISLKNIDTITGNTSSSSSSSWQIELINNPRIPHEAIFVFGGWQKGRPSQNVYVFDARKDEWITFEPQSEVGNSEFSLNDWIVLPTALMSFGICLVNNRYIYIAGGEHVDTKTTPNVIRLDLLAKFNAGNARNEGRSGWKTCPPLHESRRDLVLVNLNNRTLYAIGGDNNKSVLNSVEKYDLNVESWMVSRGWTEAPSMLVARGAPAADSLNGVLYVCGGYTESRMETLTNSCEMFCPITNQWTFIQPMTQARYYAQAISVEGVLFILGGGGLTGSEANIGYGSTVERYNPETGIWELMPPAKERADFAACLFENELVCLGGGGEAFCTDEVETWKPWIPKPESDQPYPIHESFISQLVLA
ncbi:unnamed protein product [Heterobilharzia americana]|nr:unnamed protein product [Heterobilharzia americana]